MVESHLSLLKPKNGTIVNRTHNVTAIKSAKKVVLPKNENSSRDRFVVDLTVALKTVETQPIVAKKKIQEKVEKTFEIPFIDCEVELLKPVDTLECKLDISEIVFHKCNNFKGISKFGKVLCRKYTRVKPYKINFNDTVVHNCKVFNFKTPSPDDMILACLKKM